MAYNENLTEVHYLKRSISEGFVQWKIVKIVPHTPESMPLVARVSTRTSMDQRASETSFGIAVCILDTGKSMPATALGFCALCLASMATLSSLAVLLSTSRWTWTRFFACAGLPASVLLGGLPWGWVNIVEHLPFESSHWFRSRTRHTDPTCTASQEHHGFLSQRELLLHFRLSRGLCIPYADLSCGQLLRGNMHYSGLYICKVAAAQMPNV